MIVHKTISLADQVFERLESDILTGVYSRGEILTEQKLCEALGVSRTPVREALKRLEQEHLVEDSGKGLQVLSITAEDAACIYELRIRIEGMAAAACAENITEEQLKTLRDTIELQKFYAEKGDSEKVKSLDSEFHELIYKLSGSTVLYDTLVPLHRKIQKFRRTSVEQRSRAIESAAEHESICESIAKRDPEAAELAMKVHIINARDRLAAHNWAADEEKG